MQVGEQKCGGISTAAQWEYCCYWYIVERNSPQKGVPLELGCQADVVSVSEFCCPLQSHLRKVLNNVVQWAKHHWVWEHQCVLHSFSHQNAFPAAPVLGLNHLSHTNAFPVFLCSWGKQPPRLTLRGQRAIS